MKTGFPPDRYDARHLATALTLLLLACVVACQPKQADQQSNKATTTTQNQTDPSKQPETKYHHGVGVITKITPQDPSVGINHEEIKGLMPAMTMEFYVKDKSLIDSLQVGDKVDFTIEARQGTEVISEIKKRQ
jgi:Cu/Ag efflux protein CusF